jgi:hypothetical protein
VVPLRPISKVEARNISEEDPIELIVLSLNNNHPDAEKWTSEDVERLTTHLIKELLLEIQDLSGFNISQFSIDALLRTDEARNIIWLDYCGYHLVSCQGDLTGPQEYFITKGRSQLYKEMNQVKK